MSLSAPIIINLRVGGVSEVSKAFAGIQAAAEKMETSTARKSESSSKARVTTAEKEAKRRIAATQSIMAKMTEHYTRFAAEEAKLSKNAAKSSLSWLRGWSTSMDSVKSKAQLAAESVHKSFKALDSKVGLEGLRAGVRDLTRDIAKFNKEAGKAPALSRGALQGKAFGTGLKNVGGSVLGGVMKVGGVAAALGGGYSVADAVQRGMSAETAAVALSNTMYDPNSEEQKKFLGGKRFDKNKIMDLAGRAQAETGIKKADFIKGVQSYVTMSADWKSVTSQEGNDKLIELARMSKGGDVDFADTMNAAGSLRNQNKEMTPEKLQELMYGIVGQGKSGAIELKSLAGLAGAATSTSASYGYGGKNSYANQAEAQAGLLGLAQVARPNAASDAEAVTSVKAFSSDLTSKGKKAEASFAGLHLFDKDNKLLKASVLAENIFSATKGDMTRMGEGKGNIGFGREAIHVMQGLGGIYTDSYKKESAALKSDKAFSDPVAREKEARKRAARAVGVEVEGFEKKTYSKTDADTDLKEVLNTKAERFNKAMTMLLEVTERRAAPFIEKLAASLEANEPKIEKLIEGIANMASKLVDNPLEGLGVIFGAAVAAEVAKAALGKMIGNALQGAIGGQAAAGLSIVAGAIMIGELGKMAIDHVSAMASEKESKDSMSGSNLEQERVALLNKVRSGNVSASDIANAQQTLTMGQKQVDEMSGPGLMENALRGVLTTFGSKETVQAIDDKDAAQDAERKRAVESLNAFTSALKVAQDQLAKHPGGPGPAVSGNRTGQPILPAKPGS